MRTVSSRLAVSLRSVADSTLSSLPAHLWDDPSEFRPERFAGDYNKDAFLPFATGPRGCIGRRFAEGARRLRCGPGSLLIELVMSTVEMVCVITEIIRDFEVLAVPHEGESHEQMRDRLLSFSYGLTLTPQSTDLTFRKR